MSVNPKTRLALLLLCVCATAARAELVWEKNEIELHPTIDDTTAVAHFKYQNKGDKPVNITNVKTSCGCTAASTNKNGVAPGEKGEITATFQIGGRMGLQQKGITVTTDDPAHPEVALNLKVQIPQTIDLQPAFIFWKPGEEATPKIIVAKVDKGFPITKLEANASGPEFTAKVEPGSSKEEYQITVVPTQTTQGAAATIAVNAQRPDGTTKTFSATARVLPPAPPAGATPATTPVTAARARAARCLHVTDERRDRESPRRSAPGKSAEREHKQCRGLLFHAPDREQFHQSERSAKRRRPGSARSERVLAGDL